MVDKDKAHKWEIKQHIEELGKKLKRLAKDSAEYAQTALRIENYKKDIGEG